MTGHWSPGSAVAELPRTNLSEPQSPDPYNGDITVPCSPRVNETGLALGCVIVRYWPTYHLRSVIGEERAIPFLGFGGFVEELRGVTRVPLGAMRASAPRLRADCLRLPRGPVGGAVGPAPPPPQRGWESRPPAPRPATRGRGGFRGPHEEPHLNTVGEV